MEAESTDSEPSGQALPAGTRLVEFVIERVLGSGGFGITYLASDTSLNRQVVIKENLPAQFAWRETTTGTVRPRHTSGGDADDYEWSMKNFLREADTLASLDHPGIVRVLRKFEANGTAYFVMPFVEGVAFDVLIEDRRAKGQPFSEEELKGLLDRLLDALGYLHDRGIYHRDIKPGNILISTQGIPALIDFGSARQRLSERSMTVVESAGYTPFEQLQTRGNVGPWSDLYALAATIEKAITSNAPPKAADRIGKDPRIPLAERQELAGKYSPALLASIDQALAVDDQKRWQSAEQWQAALVTRQVTAPAKSAVRPSPSVFPGPVDEWERKSRLAVVALSAAWNGDGSAEQQSSQVATPAKARPARIFAGITACLVVFGMMVWMFKRRDPANDTPTVATDQSPAVIPALNEEPAPSPMKPASPFAAATVSPAIWEQMAKLGDPLAQALLGDALYWGGQKNHGIQMDPAEGVKWIEKSANAGHPLGRYLLGLAKDGDGKWLPRDEEAAEKDYAEAVRLGLVRDAENGGPVWWTAVARILWLGAGVETDLEMAMIWYQKAADQDYSPALYKLGILNYSGKGEANSRKAVIWFEKAAEQGYGPAQNVLGNCYLSGEVVPKDEVKGASLIQKAAEQGYSQAQYNLGRCYSRGRGVTADPKKAVIWYQKAADQGHFEAQLNLGNCYFDGNGIAESRPEAVRYYRKAAEAGYAPAQLSLGVCYDNGEGIIQDDVEAVKWYRKAADQGNAIAQLNLGACYDNGEGIIQDDSEAVKWYRLAADQGNATAQYNLGICYQRGEGAAENSIESVNWLNKAAEQGHIAAKKALAEGGLSTLGSEVPEKSADTKTLGQVERYKKAAEQGDSEAQLNLGNCYFDGNGIAESKTEAVRYYRMAAESGYAPAQLNLGACYDNGEGIVRNDVDAVKWYRKAAEQGNAKAQLNLGACYDNGEGIIRDDVEAVKWYRMAANQGDATAQYNLGICYHTGEGITQNRVESANWISKAAEQGHEGAKKVIAEGGLSTVIPDSSGKPAKIKMPEQKDAAPVNQPSTDFPVAIQVPNKPGFVFSPYNNKVVDVQNFPRGTLVEDPTYSSSTKKYFRVP